MIRILVFGDSIAYGAWDSEGGWADRIKRYYHRQYLSSDGKTKVQVLNLGVGGHNSSHIRDRLRAEIEFRTQEAWETVLVFSFGTNDARAKDGEVITSAQRFRENVKDIVLTAQAYADRIMFVGVPPLTEAEVSFKGDLFVDKLVHEYEQELVKIVEKAGITFVPIREIFVKHGLDGLYGVDGIHPKDEGHQLIFDAVWPQLDKLLS